MTIRAVVIVTTLDVRLIIPTCGDARAVLIVSLKLGGELPDFFFGGGEASVSRGGACHTCTVLSLLPEAMRFPSGDHVTVCTLLEWPR